MPKQSKSPYTHTKNPGVSLVLLIALLAIVSEEIEEQETPKLDIIGADGNAPPD